MLIEQNNVLCRDTNHQNEIDSFIAEVLGCIEEEAFLSLPVSKPNSGQQKLHIFGVRYGNLLVDL
jgi:hypothetical protein